MKFRKLLFLLSLVSIALIVVNFAVSQDSRKLENLQIFKIDGFETPGEWVVKFSKFRSRLWDLSEETDKNSELYIANDANSADGKGYWLRWITAEDKENYRREDILPDGVLKDPVIKMKAEKGGEPENTILSIRAAWDFKGWNWVSLEPNGVKRSKECFDERVDLVDEKERKDAVESGKLPGFVYLSGKTKSLLVYVWSSGYDYDLEYHLEDYLGNVYVLPASNLAYYGWKKIRVDIPSYIRQEKEYLPKVEPLKFLRFKINTSPTERVKGFHCSFDYFHYITDTYEESFYGEKLLYVNKDWDRPAIKKD